LIPEAGLLRPDIVNFSKPMNVFIKGDSVQRF
jgi:hypothetical protein